MKNMTIHQAKSQLIQITDDSQCADMILGHLLKVPRSYLFTHVNLPLTDHQESVLREYMSRLSKNEPIQYILGYADFMNIRLTVTPDVLIPRSDTETLVLVALAAIRKNGYSKILDMCTGSGAIALGILHELPGKKYNAVCADISAKALSVAQRNAQNLYEKRVSFIESDFFSAFDANNDKFDIIVSNPPYIEKGDISELMPQVRDYEPHLALDGGLDGLDAYRQLISHAPDYLAEGGTLAFEVGYTQAHRVADLMSKSFQNIEIIKDLSGIERVVKGEIAN